MKKLISLIATILPAVLLLSLAAFGCDSDSYRYSFTQAEYSTTVGVPLQLHVNRIKLPTSGNLQETSTLDTDVVFTVSGEGIRADTTSSGRTRTYTGKITPADGKFTITSESANVQVTGTITETGVSGVWRTTTSNGECTITFQGNRV